MDEFGIERVFMCKLFISNLLPKVTKILKYQQKMCLFSQLKQKHRYFSEFFIPFSRNFHFKINAVIQYE